MTGRGTYEFVKQALSKNMFEDLARRDVMNAISQYKDLRPSLERYTFNDGTSKDLLNLDGTIPVTYKGTIYNIPVCIWILESHPYKPPTVVVKPTSTMQIKPGRNVDSNGTVDLPYLRDWQYPQSDTLGLIQILVIVFGEEPPVFAKSSQAAQSPSPNTCTGPSPQPIQTANPVQAFYLVHFEKFLEDFGIDFVRYKCVEHGVDNLETFLMLQKDDLMNVFGLNLGNALKCIRAQQRFHEV